MVIYFYLITIGITSAVSVSISVLLFITLTIILFLNVFISKNKNVSEINGKSNQLTILSLEEFKYSEFENDLKLIYLQVNAEKNFEYSFFVLNEDFEQIIKNIRQYVGDNLIELSFASSIDDA